MNLDFDKSKFSCKYGYCTGKAGDLAEPALHVRSQEYKRKIGGMTRAIPAEDAFRMPKSKTYFVSRKYDGEHEMLFFDGEKLLSVNPGSTVRVGLPCFGEAAKLLKKAKLKSCILAAEIYVREESTKAHPVQQVVRILRTPSSKDQLEKLGLAIFDIVEVAGKPVTATAKVFELLNKWFADGKTAHVVENAHVDSIEDVIQRFTEWVIGEGAEGVVVRNDQNGWFKVKVRHNIDVAIIGYSEGVENRKGMLHDLLVAVVRTDGTFHEFTRVGGGFTDDDRRSIIDELRRRTVPSEYVAVNNDYVAYEMIHPGPVIEISCLDMIAERARGGPVKRMVLDWTGKHYRALTRMPLVSVISPQFIRMRDDKEATAEDVSIKQISDLVEVSEVDKPVERNDEPASELLERTVYTKTMKGNKMVRKLLLWKTNKTERADFPGFVIYLTDFSPNRQNPLERDMKIAHTEATARKIFKQIAEKNFIGGWEKVK
ncbi:MAG: hypothetical protein ABR530_09185 [Pyrinomonadaceae bacterium]